MHSFFHELLGQDRNAVMLVGCQHFYETVLFLDAMSRLNVAVAVKTFPTQSIPKYRNDHLSTYASVFQQLHLQACHYRELRNPYQPKAASLIMISPSLSRLIFCDPQVNMQIHQPEAELHAAERQGLAAGLDIGGPGPPKRVVCTGHTRAWGFSAVPPNIMLPCPPFHRYLSRAKFSAVS